MRHNMIRLILLCLPLFSLAQQQVDGIIAVLDNNILLRSELENQIIYLRSNGEKDDGTLRCRTFEDMLSNKLLLSKAQLDSLKVSDDQVESELNRRIENFVQYFGSVAKLEENYRKSLIELKMELRPEIKELLLVEQQKAKITEDVTVTPKEVRQYYNSIPKDSLPFLPAEVTLHHIVIVPPISEKNKKEAREKMSDVRHQILFEKMKFAEMAKYYSQDGSAQQGGYLGEFTRGRMVPEFEEVVYNLKEGEISEVFETEFGFHIVQLHKRLGETVSASHILVRPIRDKKDDEKAIERLKEIRQMIQTDTISFEKAASIYSDDKESKDCGGCILNPSTGENKIPLDALDAELFFKVDKLKAGEVSEPLEIILRDGIRAYHIVKLKQKYLPHTANLKDDYQKLAKAALEEKKQEAIDSWYETARRQVFIEIKYAECANAVKTWNPKE
jgi:peptidyl-prolyl cis-trans isomerase SurA